MLKNGQFNRSSFSPAQGDQNMIGLDPNSKGIINSTDYDNQKSYGLSSNTNGDLHYTNIIGRNKELTLKK